MAVIVRLVRVTPASGAGSYEMRVWAVCCVCGRDAEDERCRVGRVLSAWWARAVGVRDACGPGRTVAGARQELLRVGGRGAALVALARGGARVAAAALALAWLSGAERRGRHDQDKPHISRVAPWKTQNSVSRENNFFFRYRVCYH